MGIIGTIAVVAIAAIAAVGVAAGWYLLVRDDASLAEDPPDIPDVLISMTATPTPEAAATSPTDVAEATEEPVASEAIAYTIQSDLSEAAYFVDEELASVGLPSTAKGATNEVTGTLYVLADLSGLDPAQTSQFVVGLTNLTSDESMRDNRVQQALETGTYSTATFTITSVTGYDPSIPEGQTQTMQLTGILDLHGVQNEVTWEVEAYREGTAISALATITINFSDYNITAPTFGGLVSISDQATLQVQLIATAA
jgi:polyisoprenoid-binding protein YceI